jgi:hypothetical protein
MRAIYLHFIGTAETMLDIAMTKTLIAIMTFIIQPENLGMHLSTGI